MMKKIFIFSTLIFLSAYLLIILSSYLLTPVTVRGQEKAQAIDIGMTAQVPSPVSAANSTVALNATETLADPVNHPILLTVYLLDSNKQPLADKEVVITSNRGNVDVIETTSKLSQYQVHAADVADLQKDKTDSGGKVSFRITSFIPGKAIFQVLADNIVKLKDQTVQFNALPFPADLTITIDLLWTQKEWTIVSPHLQEDKLSPAQKEAKTIAKPGAKIKINFWIFALSIFIVIGMPIFIILSFINLRKIRSMEKEQSLLLKKMFPPNYNRHG